MTTRTAPAADVAAQVDALVVDLESRVWADVPAVQNAKKKVQLALTAGPALHRLVAGLPSVDGVMRAAYDRLARGEDIDAEKFTVAVAGAGATMDAARAATILTSGGIDSARAELVSAERAGQNVALATLDAILKKLVTVARPIIEVASELEGSREYARIGQAQVAIERATVAHTRIRGIQMKITYDPMDPYPERLLRRYGIVRDVRACLPTRISMANPGAAYDPVVPSIDDGDEMLAFICRADLQVWVPSYQQARQAKADLDRHVAELRDRAENPIRRERDGSDDPVVTIQGGAGQTPVVRTR